MRSEVSFQLISFFFKIWGSIFVSYSFFLDKMSIIVGLLKKNAKRTTWYGKWKNVERDHLLTSSEAKTTDILQQLSHVILFSYKPENEHRSFVGGKKIHPLHVLSSGTSIAPCSIGSCMNLASKQLSIALVSWT